MGKGNFRDVHLALAHRRRLRPIKRIEISPRDAITSSPSSPVHAYIDRNGVTRILLDGEAFCPCRRELTSPLPSDVGGGRKKFFVSPWFSEWTRAEKMLTPEQSGCHLSHVISLYKIRNKLNAEKGVLNFNNSDLLKIFRII